MQLNVTLYKFICIIINTFAPREIGYDFSWMVSHMECNWWWLLYLCMKKVSLKHRYDITEVCCLLNILCFVVTKLQTLITICSAFCHQSVWFAWLFFMPYTRGAAKYQPSSVLCQMACRHHHISVMEMGHLLTRSSLMYPEVSSKVSHDSFCQLWNSVSLPLVIYYGAFYLHVVSSVSCIPVICLKLVLFLIPLQFVHLFCNQSKCVLLIMGENIARNV